VELVRAAVLLLRGHLQRPGIEQVSPPGDDG